MDKKPIQLREVLNRRGYEKPGDYWFTSDGTLILSCPFCGIICYSKHKIIQKFPLTLQPSVVEHPCEHHFMVDNGWAI